MLIRRGIIYVLGMLITYFGTALVVKSALGAGFWSALYVGMSQTVGLSVGIWFALIQIGIVVLNAKLRNQKPDWLAIIPILIESAAFTLWLEYILQDVQFEEATLLVKTAVFLTGMTIASLGIGIYIHTGFTRAPVDELFLSLSHRFRLKMSASQSLIAATVTLTALLLGGPVGLGTFLSILVFGPFIQFWSDCISKLLSVYTSSTPSHAENG
ncbi:YitT family protein [Pontibacillus salicampi]|uniref:YitT family protein n=1 Tax=Pontibacillus salicampi TaxID=1449801 RepID=A0ABV6LM85_9BACI